MIMKTYEVVVVKFHTFLTSALMEVSDQLHTSDASSPGKAPSVPIGWELVWGSVGLDSVAKKTILALVGNRVAVFQTVASHFTASAVSAQP
jgi:hypothetical protein